MYVLLYNLLAKVTMFVQSCSQPYPIYDCILPILLVTAPPIRYHVAVGNQTQCLLKSKGHVWENTADISDSIPWDMCDLCRDLDLTARFDVSLNFGS